MTIAHLWNSMSVNALMTHLWQSTVFAGLVWLLTNALRNGPARIRFSVWMAASIKFLVPFAFLTALGSHWALPNSRPLMHGTFYTIIEDINQPFATGPLRTRQPDVPAHSLVGHSGISIALASIWFCGCIVTLIRWTRHWHSARRIMNESAPMAEGREVVALRKAEAKLRIRKHIPVVATSKAVEPGIFGVMRPVLMWPAGLSELLDDAHISSIVAHELEHVRRGDNLTAALHTLVEAVFWFHPAVWWMGIKLTEERERACDEEVLEQNAEPRTYADSILKVCAFCLESPQSCVAGVSGSDLRKRVLRITSHRTGETLTFGCRASLLAAAVMAITLPIGFGVVRGQPAAEYPGSIKSALASVQESPRFDVASVKPGKPVLDQVRIQFTADGFIAENTPPLVLIEVAFGVKENQILGLPNWAKTDTFDILAKVSSAGAGDLRNLAFEQRQRMIIPLLTDRFSLRVHHENKEGPVYELVVAKGGPKLKEIGEAFFHDGTSPQVGLEKEKPSMLFVGAGKIVGQGASISSFVNALSGLNLGRPIIDKTNLTGKYDFKLQWTQDMGVDADVGGAARGSKPIDSSPASFPPLFTALQEQMGLKLESRRGTIDAIVVDAIEKPSPN